MTDDLFASSKIKLAKLVLERLNTVWRPAMPTEPLVRQCIANVVSELLSQPEHHQVDVMDIACQYEQLLHQRPQVDDATGRLSWVSDAKARRKSSGSYYTPGRLCIELLEAILPPLLQQVDQSTDPPAALLRLKIVDPSCGTGDMILIATEILAHHLCELRQGTKVRRTLQQARLEVLTNCIYGVDNDPIAIKIAQRIAQCLVPDPNALLPNLRVGDSLAGFDWRREFPEVFTGADDEGFDAVVGNPPFVNAIEGRVDDATKQRLRQLYPEVRGSADLAYYFLSLSLRLLRPEGWLGLIQPRAALNALALTQFRRSLLPTHSPRVLMTVENPKVFAGAAVFVALVVIGPAGPCRCGQWTDVKTIGTGVERMITDDNWWRALHDSITPPTLVVNEPFDIAASMTAGDAYDLVPFLVDAARGCDPKLITTGLIEPGACLWGQAKCRYLKRDYQHPRVRLTKSASPSLRRRLANARRPKLLVAGLSARVEAFFDASGGCVGAVSTFTILHPHDDIDQLMQFCDHLNSAAVTAAFCAELGANAMGGGNITMTKRFIQQLPMLCAGMKRTQDH